MRVANLTEAGLRDLTAELSHVHERLENEAKRFEHDAAVNEARAIDIRREQGALLTALELLHGEIERRKDKAA